METNSNKSRTPSRCREWERNRRNKFNDAIVRLGEVVKDINSVNSGCKESENVQYPKIEIIEKAIICLTNCFKENSQLKAEILALQIKNDSDKKQKENKKDASTQVFIGITKKNKSDKYVKVLMLKNLKRKALKEKTILSTNVKMISKDPKAIPKPANFGSNAQSIPPKPPLILPKVTAAEKKGPENTILVLPATPYIFPQRSLIIPTAPPAFVLLDNGQTLNKSVLPVMNRNNNDITKTTMVNILPISAYSRPLSATKLKKNSTKSKSDVSKKSKKVKATNSIKELRSSTNDTTPNSNASLDVQSKEKDKEITKTDKPTENKNTENISLNTDTCEVNVSENNDMTNNIDIDNKNQTSKEDIPKELDINNSSKEIISKCTEMMEEEQKALDKKTSEVVVEKSCENSKIKVPFEKETTDKDKENKLPNILDTALCESTVDGGNARLELAEEFLAASPTAAFLMSFPLVSGNRADSPADENTNAIHVNSKESNHRRNELNSQTISYFEKPNPVDIKVKQPNKQIASSSFVSKPSTENKYVDNTVSKVDAKTTTNTTNDNPFLNLPMASQAPTNLTVPDTSFSLDFDCMPSKTIASQTSYNNSNFFYKNDPFSTVKSTIYSTSNISSGHEFNSFSLYPCAMEKYTTKNKSDYSNVEENIMKIGSSRLTYDIDLGWSHKGFDFVSCTSASNSLNKDTIYTTAAAPYSTSYNPFNPEFHVPLVSNSNKKDNIIKTSSSFPETIASFYSQPSALWTEEVPFYTNNNNSSKSLTSKNQNYLPIDHMQSTVKVSKQYELKQVSEPAITVAKSLSGVNQHHISEKYNKKSSPNKMHINWMTSEIRPMQGSCNSAPTGLKDTQKSSYTQLDQLSKRHNYSESNYFPISMHGFSSQTLTDDLQIWSSARPAGTTEISIEPPPINLPTLVGDLALGPHDKKKSDTSSRTAPQSDIQNCSNFFSVTQLMNRSTENNLQSRYQSLNVDTPKQVSAKQNITQNNDASRKIMTRTESHAAQPYYVFNESKSLNSYENLNQFSHNKQKASKTDKNTKVQKNSYSAESLIRGGTCSQKHMDNNAKFIPSQKYNDFNGSQDSSVAQVSHFPAILDYSDNSFAGQQFSGTNLYNSTANTSFYSNFMSGGSNIMTGNYTSGPFSGDFMDYNQTAECNYPNHKYTELKMRNNSIMFQQDKAPSSYKSSRRESTAKHKLECSKKESNKKCQPKRAKPSNETEEWSDSSHMLWQNKTATKRHSNLISEELSFPNFVSNQVSSQYQPEFFNSHLMPANMQPVSHNAERSVASFPVTSRANFNLSTIFPEITMKVQ